MDELPFLLSIFVCADADGDSVFACINCPRKVEVSQATADKLRRSRNSALLCVSCVRQLFPAFFRERAN